MRRSKPPVGYTVPEVIVVLVICATLLAIALPRIQAQLDRIAVRGAVSDVVSVINTARALALSGQTAVAVGIDSTSDVVRVRRGSEVLLERGLAREHRVQVIATRDSLAFDAHGMGHGAANLSIIIRQGVIADTVFVSRFGRVR